MTGGKDGLNSRDSRSKVDRTKNVTEAWTVSPTVRGRTLHTLSYTENGYESHNDPKTTPKGEKRRVPLNFQTSVKKLR